MALEFVVVPLTFEQATSGMCESAEHFFIIMEEETAKTGFKGESAAWSKRATRE